VFLLLSPIGGSDEVPEWLNPPDFSPFSFSLFHKNAARAPMRRPLRLKKNLSRASAGRAAGGYFVRSLPCLNRPLFPPPPRRMFCWFRFFNGHFLFADVHLRHLQRFFESKGTPKRNAIFPPPLPGFFPFFWAPPWTLRDRF